MEKKNHYSLRKLACGLVSVAVASFISLAGMGQAQADSYPVPAQDSTTLVSQQAPSSAQTEIPAASQVSASESAGQDQVNQTSPQASQSDFDQRAQSQSVSQPEGNQVAQGQISQLTANQVAQNQVVAQVEEQKTETQAAPVADNQVQATSINRASVLRRDAATTRSRYSNTFVDDGQGNWYYLDENGENVTGQQTIKGQNLYFAADGKQVKGQEVTLDGKTYYYDGDSGDMWVNRFRQAEAGNSWYYYGGDGAKVYGSQEINNQKLYFDPNTGLQVKGSFAQDSEGKNHYYDTETGSMLTNRFLQVNQAWYYLDNDGVPLTGSQSINGQNLYFKEDGQQVKGDFVEVRGAKYYYDADSGDRLENTRRVINGITYDFDSDGEAVAVDELTVVKSSLVISSYEFGPSVSKIILEFNHPVQLSFNWKDATVTTDGLARQILNAYVSDAAGHVVVSQDSPYLTLDLNVPYDTNDSSKNASPFSFDLQSWHNVWKDSYTVEVKGLQVRAEDSSAYQDITSNQNAIWNRLTPDADRFTERGSYGQYQYAAYQPQQTSTEKVPLLVWLHGIGEVGTDVNVPILAANLAKLTQSPIQDHFTSTGTGSQKGAQVLVIQSPVPWNKDQTSNLMAAIRYYVANHPNVDPKRIYLAGASNGGGMTLDMGVAYPRYFAALVPIAAPADSYLSNNGTTLDSKARNALKNQAMWFVQTRADETVNSDTNALPFYKELLKSGAQNKWLSYFETNVGEFSPNITYNGHWSWVYFLNDQVTGVQNTDNAKTWEGLSGLVATNATHGGDSQALTNGRSYKNIFDWLNAQVRR